MSLVSKIQYVCVHEHLDIWKIKIKKTPLILQDITEHLSGQEGVLSGWISHPHCLWTAGYKGNLWEISSRLHIEFVERKSRRGSGCLIPQVIYCPHLYHSHYQGKWKSMDGYIQPSLLLESNVKALTHSTWLLASRFSSKKSKDLTTY